MKLTIAESMALARAVREFVERHDTPDLHIALCPSHAALSEVGKILATSGIALGAQDAAHVDRASLTGATSPLHLAELGVKEVIIGHSERRAIFGETDESVNKKLIAALEHNLIPIFCIGERLEEREQGIEKNIVQNQLKKGLEGIGKYKIAKIVIAYEPVWAIGTGKNATPEQAQEMHAFIRSTLKKTCGADIAAQIKILYGGSVKPDNIEGLIRQKDIGGALVGGASLDAEGFAKIVKTASDN